MDDTTVAKNGDKEGIIAAQEPKNPVGFPLHKLPIVAFIEVIRTMTIQQRIKLALSSSTMELLLQIAKPKPYTIILNLAGEESQVTIYYKTFLFCGEDSFELKGYENVKKADLSPWLNPELSTHENTINVYRRILKIFPTNFFKLAIRLTDNNQAIIREMLAVSDLKNFKEIMINGEKIDKENLDLVMETLEKDRSIVLRVKSIPDGYYHENLFKFVAVEYLATGWIKVEHLFTFRDMQRVKLNRCSFTTTDINILLKHWTNCDNDMFKKMHLIFDENTDVSIEGMCDGLVALSCYRNGDNFILVACKPGTSRKYQFMSIFHREDRPGIRFTCRLIDRPFPHNQRPAEPFRQEFEILEILSQKKVLEDRLKVILEPLEKREIEEQLRELRNDLEERGVLLNGQLPEVLPN